MEARENIFHKNEMINCKNYWDKHFEDPKENEKREAQTKFFYTLAINNLPKWISEDIQNENMSICDAGCAIGDGTNILTKEFPGNMVSGFDFSENAIVQAKKKYPECSFFVDNINTFDIKFDVIFSSNVCEHFYNAKEIIERLVSCANRYCILLLPFREYYMIEEHFSYFDFQSFPLFINKNYQLCYFKAMTMTGQQQEYWFGEQILVIYGNRAHLANMDMSLRNFYNGYIEERTEIIKLYDKKLGDFEKIINKLQEQNKIYKDLIDSKISEVKEVQKVNHEMQERNKICQQRIETKTLELEDSEKIIKELQQVNKSYKDFFEKKKNLEHEISKQISIVQNSKSYRYSLIIKRFVTQCFIGKEKKDFVKWFVSKILHKSSATKFLSEFDRLEDVKRNLKTNQQFTNEKFPLIENNKFKLKEGTSVVIFASVPFYDVGGGQRSAQFAKTFNTLGYRVYYIYGFPCTEENIPDVFIPAVAHKFIDDVSGEWFKSIIGKESIVMFEIPYWKFEAYLEQSREADCFTIYEHIDNWDSSLGCLFYDKNVFRKFLENSDLITVTAKKLGEKIEEITQKKFLYLPNAVNTEIFEPSKNYECPKDLVKGKNKTLLYFGSLWGEWFDWEKIDYLAEQCTDCEINLIGDYSGCTNRLNAAKNNVHFLGLKKQTDLPAYLKYSDIALLPFKNCEIGKYVSPLKIFEYISMNVKVIATNLDDIQNYPNVFCSDKKEDWVNFVNKTTDNIDSSAFISDNNWFSRCENLIKKSNIKEKIFPKVSVIVLNYNNLNVIRRCIETLITHKSRYDYEIIVIDNGSKDGSYEILKNFYSENIILVQNSKNGCSSGRNLGVKKSNGKYICFLDSDQWIESDYWLDSALELLEKKHHIGAVAWNAGWFAPGKTTGPIVDYLPNRALDSGAIWYRTDIAYLATSGFLMKKKLFEEIDGFDEFYDPTCFEDTDISLKIRNSGYEIAYCPYMSIMHLPHQTTHSGSAEHAALMDRNGKYFMDKWKKIQPDLLEYYY